MFIKGISNLWIFAGLALLGCGQAGDPAGPGKSQNLPPIEEASKQDFVDTWEVREDEEFKIPLLPSASPTPAATPAPESIPGPNLSPSPVPSVAPPKTSFDIEFRYQTLVTDLQNEIQRLASLSSKEFADEIASNSEKFRKTLMKEKDPARYLALYQSAREIFDESSAEKIAKDKNGIEYLALYRVSLEFAELHALPDAPKFAEKYAKHPQGLEQLVKFTRPGTDD